jgi:hypothetical protein
MGRSSHLSFARAVPVALLLALAAPAVARADATVSVTGRTLMFEVDDALGHGPAARVQNGEIVVTDVAGLSVGAGCTLAGGAAHCGAPDDVDEAVFTLGDGNDFLDLQGFPLAVTASGGGGADLLYGGLGDDSVSGGPGGDEIDGTAGDDEVFGDSGNDAVYGGAGFDLVDGGDGDDRVWANEVTAQVDFEISCGADQDVVIAYDDGDPIADDCEATDPPYLDGELRITGDPREGSALALSLPQNRGGDGVATIRWERCNASGDGCVDIGAVGLSYTPTRRDVGWRLRAWYRVENALGDDLRVSEPTAAVAALPPTPRPPRPTTTRPPRPMPMPFLVIPPLAVTRKPYFAIRNGDPVVDTGRAMTCPGVFGGAACRLKVAAVPTGATAHVHGRPSSLGKGSELVAATASHVRVRVPLNLRAYRLLRAKRKLTLLVTVTVTRAYSGTVQSTFTITVRMPAQKRR